MNIKLCQGCASFKREDLLNCPILLSNNQDKCPCTHCLIKVMCKLCCIEMRDLWYCSINEERGVKQ
jgi:hypothetical protein